MAAPINRAILFDRLRASGLLGTTLSQTEVDGVNGILDGWGEQGWPTDLRWVAYTLATAWHEAHLNMAIREIGRGKGKKYGLPAGPYSHVYYGRGPSQITWLDNYQKFSKLVGVDFVKDPDLVLEPLTGAAILIIGSRDGIFRPGKTLGRYFSATADDPVGARDIINGDVTKNGPMIAKHHAVFLSALKAAYDPASLSPSAPVSGVLATKSDKPPSVSPPPLADAIAQIQVPKPVTVPSAANDPKPGTVRTGGLWSTIRDLFTRKA